MLRFSYRAERSPVLDMTPDGRFRAPPARSGPLAQIGLIAFAVAVIAGGLAIAALALWFALAIIPVAIAAALVAYAIFRFQLWRARGAFSAPRRPPI
jgi:uncharacterized membrane protein